MLKKKSMISNIFYNNTGKFLKKFLNIWVSILFLNFRKFLLMNINIIIVKEYLMLNYNLIICNV